jgi:diaminopimelate epimerase
VADIKFTKCESLFNDFCVVEWNDRSRWTSSRVRSLCNRRTGAGADGLITLRRRDGEYEFRLFNADGTRAEWSGNGIRCAAVFVAQSTRRRVAVFHTHAGPIETTVLKSSRGHTVTFRRPLPVVTKPDTTGRNGHARGLRGPVHVDAGNPHWVYFARNFDFDWEQIGSDCQGKARQSRGVNVEFVRVHTPRHIELRLFERGVGPTPSSGSGALAAFAACREQGMANASVRVSSPGGNQLLKCVGENREVELTANARVVYRGVWHNR